MSSPSSHPARRRGAFLLFAGTALLIAAAVPAAATAAPQFKSDAWTDTYVDINGGAAKTATRNVTLTLCASDIQAGANAYCYRTSTDGIHWSTWTPNVPLWPDWPTTVSYTLSAGAGTKRVYVCYYTTVAIASDFNTKALSPVVWDTIVYDPSAKVSPASLKGSAARPAAAPRFIRARMGAESRGTHWS